VKLAPEVSGEDVGNLSSIASSFGFDIGGATSQDAIYPELYPELFESSEFIVGLYDIQITTKDHKLQTDYFTYIKEHQKKNPLTWPFIWTTLKLTSLFESEDTITSSNGQGGINPFTMSRKDYMLMQNIMEKISCSVDKKTSVITIKVQDQDPLVCAIMADSVKAQLQNFIIRYRTSKVVEDVVHYQQLRDSAEAEYDLVMQAYSRFCDTHNDIILQSYQSERDKLESELALKQNSLTAIEAQLQTTKVKLREKTPAFTTLKSATVPVKPAGPKRVLFIALMMVLSTIGGSIYILRKIIKKSI
jgi:capsular polysaccharide biosynthesis protein